MKVSSSSPTLLRFFSLFSSSTQRNYESSGRGREASCPEQWSALDSESPFTASSPRNVTKPDCVFGGKADRLSSRTRAFNQDYVFRIRARKKNLSSRFNLPRESRSERISNLFCTETQFKNCWIFCYKLELQNREIFHQFLYNFSRYLECFERVRCEENKKKYIVENVNLCNPRYTRVRVRTRSSQFFIPSFYRRIGSVQKSNPLSFVPWDARTPQPDMNCLIPLSLFPKTRKNEEIRRKKDDRGSKRCIITFRFIATRNLIRVYAIAVENKRREN